MLFLHINTPRDCIPSSGNEIPFSSPPSSSLPLDLLLLSRCCLPGKSSNNAMRLQDRWRSTAIDGDEVGEVAEGDAKGEGI